MFLSSPLCNVRRFLADIVLPVRASHPFLPVCSCLHPRNKLIVARGGDVQFLNSIVPLLIACVRCYFWSVRRVELELEGETFLVKKGEQAGVWPPL